MFATLGSPLRTPDLKRAFMQEAQPLRGLDRFSKASKGFFERPFQSGQDTADRPSTATILHF
ncbi:hypothetical protein DTW92_18330 [Paracoccus pantotrophus]|nr:hypothetical protein DTW92_18330 [Paracoccus pantotrophus]